MQDILRNYYESGGKTLFESPEQISEIDFKKAAATVGAVASLAGAPDVSSATSSDIAKQVEITKQVEQQINAGLIASLLVENAVSVKVFGIKGKLSADIMGGVIIDNTLTENGGELVYKFKYNHQMVPALNQFGKLFGIDIASGTQYEGVLKIKYGMFIDSHPIQSILLILDSDNMNQHIERKKAGESIPVFKFPPDKGAEFILGKPIRGIFDDPPSRRNFS